MSLLACKPSVIRTNNDPLFCPSSSLVQEEVVEPPKTKSDAEFHEWASRLYAKYIPLHKKHKDLAECWDNEQKKRARK